MSWPILAVTVERLDGRVRVRVAGDLDLTSTDTFLATVRRLSSQYDATQIELDLQRVEFIDLHGLDALTGAARTVETSGRMKIVHPPLLLDVLFDHVGGRDRFDVEPAS